MSIKAFSRATAFGLFLLVAGVSADQLTITGTVKDSAGAAVAGAIVSIGGGGMGGGARDTTDAAGAYTLVIANNTATSVTVTARNGTGGAGGFTTATGTVAAPSDGTADEITVAITLGSSIVPAAGDTMVVSGTVKDSAGAAVAGAIVTIGGGGGMGGGARDTTDAAGAYSITRANTSRATTVTVTATLTSGTTVRSGTGTGTIAAPADGTKDLVTVNIVINNGVTPPAAGDTVVVSGTVKDSAGAAVPDAVITYRFGTGGTGGAAVDTTDATGAYSFTVVNTNRQTSLRVTASIGTAPAAQTGRTTISIAAPADGKTDKLSVNITLGETMNSIRPASIGVARAPTARSIIGVYQLNGRQLDKSIFTNALVKGPKAAVVRYRDGARMKLSVEK
jgi:protocatechuate 3,4-dioxygenase beta subunit